MRTVRTRISIWCCLLVALLMTSGCFSEPPEPPSEGPDWVSVKTTTKLPDVVIEKVTYRSGDLDIEGQVCRPPGDGRHPVLISNHGGFAGLADWDDANGFCAKAAQMGWVLAESSYRGEDGSDGEIEVCLGEVDDVLAMIDVVRSRSYADQDRIAMLGVSHGGCVTSRAVERGADVDLAVEIAGPTDLTALFRELKKNPSNNPALRKVSNEIRKRMEKSIGGTPDEKPEQYAMRSPDAEKIARWDKPYLIMHGVNDTIVPVQQSCDLARKVGDFQAYRFDLYGGVVGKAPPGCEELTWNDSPGTFNEFNDDRYLLVYDKVDHFLIANNGVARMTSAFLRFLEVKLPAV